MQIRGPILWLGLLAMVLFFAACGALNEYAYPDTNELPTLEELRKNTND